MNYGDSRGYLGFGLVFFSACLQRLKIISSGNLCSSGVCTPECDHLGCGSRSNKITEDVNVAPST